MPIPEFIATLRTKVGTDLLWLTGVTAVVFDEAGRVLLGLRSDTHRWALISGVLEPGEEPSLAVAREVEEETGIRASVGPLAAIRITHPITYPNGDQAQYLDLVFLCQALGDEPRVCDDESLAVGWFGLGALPEPIAAYVRPCLDTVLAFQRAPQAGAGFLRA